LDKWEGQETRVEVWIEKDALKGVIAGVCDRLEVPYFACRGYVSASEMWAAAMRIKDAWENSWTPEKETNQRTAIIHLGDHDPSGIDMTRDIKDRINLFLKRDELNTCDVFDIRRIALNMDQIEALNPPPNPAKTTDTRYESYNKQYGGKSWELDALEPKIINDLVEETVLEYRDLEAWDTIADRETETRATFHRMAQNYDKVYNFLKEV
jgi:hypothetical protein